MKYKTELMARDLISLTEQTHNIYESVAIIAKRARQIALRTKEELDHNLAELAPEDGVEQEANEDDIRKLEAIINRYERMPKPTTVATEEFLAEELMYRYPDPAI